MSHIYFDKRVHRAAQSDLRATVRRQAIELAQRWLDPMTHAIAQTEYTSSRFLYGYIDQAQFRLDWPADLTNKLAELDLPSHLRPYLPEGLQQSGVSILAGFSPLYFKVLSTNRSDMAAVYQTLDEAKRLHREIDALRHDLEAAHRKTLA
jgi:hypothetical protein